MYIVALFLGAYFSVYSQINKNIFAKSFFQKKAPELIIEQWVSKTPETKGKYVLVDFWATNCGSCVSLIPKLNYFQETFKDKLIVIGVSHEPVHKLIPYKKLINYYYGTDTHKKTYSDYRIIGIPYVVLINPEGIVEWEGYPLLDTHLLTEEVIKEIIKP